MTRIPTTQEMDSITEADLPFTLALRCIRCGEWTSFYEVKAQPTACMSCEGRLDTTSIRSTRSVDSEIKYTVDVA